MVGLWASYGCEISTKLARGLGVDHLDSAVYVLSQAGATGEAESLSIFQAIVIGLVQGLTEFLPISSTAHVKAIPVALNWGDPGVALTAVMQLGSIAAILWYFWDDLVQVITGMVQAITKSDYDSGEFRLGFGVFLGTFPIVILGLGLKILVPDLDNSPIRSMGAIAIASIVMATLLAIAEKVGKRERGYDQIGVWDGIWVGAAQALAVIPGVSRSGSTLTAGLFVGLERATAARFSFLLGLPAITLAGLVELPGLLTTDFSVIGPIPLLAGLIAAVLSSYAAIAWLIKFLQNHSTWVFVWYRLGFGVVILTAIALGWVENA